MQLKLKNGIGASRDSDPEDVIKAMTVLNALGELKPDAELGLNGFVDRPFDAGVRRFQKRRGLLVTGEIKPGDETEEAINAELRQLERKGRRAGSAISVKSRIHSDNPTRRSRLSEPDGINPLNNDDARGAAFVAARPDPDAFLGNRSDSTSVSVEDPGDAGDEKEIRLAQSAESNPRCGTADKTTGQRQGSPKFIEL